jgi:hypothetical protein
MIQPDVNHPTKDHKKQAPDFQALCFAIAKKIAESVGLIDLIVPTDTVPGFSIQVAHVAPPVVVASKNQATFSAFIFSANDHNARLRLVLLSIPLTARVRVNRFDGVRVNIPPCVTCS